MSARVLDDESSVAVEELRQGEERVRGAGPATFDFRRHVPALDGLRGLAILAVFIYHYAGGIANHPTGLALRAMYSVTQVGWAGVDLFFVLSGFLITGILYDTKDDVGYYRKFYARRTLRIFPVYYLFLGIVAVVGLLTGVHWTLGHASFLLYVGFPCALAWPSLIPASEYIRVTHLWSLCMEEQFYLIWPWLVAALGTPIRILRMCGVLMVVALGLRVAVYAAGWNHTWAYAFLPFRMDALAVGAALAILLRGPYRELVAKLAPAMLALAAAGFLCVCIVGRTTDHEGAAMGTAGFSLLTLVSGSLLVLGVSRYGLVRKIFSLQALRTLGKYSYGLYLYHFPLAVVLDRMKPMLGSALHSENLGKVVFVAVSLGINLGVAWVSFRLIEAPIMTWKKRFDYDRKVPLTGAGGASTVLVP